MSKIGGAFSVRFLRNGDQITLVRDIVDQSGKGAALFQTVDPNSGLVTPDWGVNANQPIVRLTARSSAGYPVEITGVQYTYDGVDLQFTYNGATWVTAGNSDSFQSRINGSAYELRIVKNLASKTVVSNKQITYAVTYVSNSVQDTLTGSADVLIQQAGASSHSIQITTDRVEISADHPTATLTAVAYYAGRQITVGSGDYSVKWYQDGRELTGRTAATLEVNRAMVAGGAHFTVKLFQRASFVVAQDGQIISDISDTYQISYTPTSAGSNYVTLNHDASYTLQLRKNGNVYAAEGVTYTWSIYNALGLKKRDGSGATVTVTASDCINVNGQNSYYGDCDVLATANFQL